MRSHVTLGVLLGFAMAMTISCGGGAGKVAVVGLGNSGNQIIEADAVAEAVADALETLGTPAVSDETIGEIYESILSQARRGDKEAALIVLSVARKQREPDEE